MGNRRRVFWLALRTGFLTLVTLGIYRFWMKTRLRRWYWSAVRPGGLPLEYVGDPLEKLLGFLIAVVFLAFYLGIVNLALMFLSFSFFAASYVAYVASFLGVLPLWFYAQYRARRYVLGRTRWMGMRFGLEPGAWGYAGRALWHWLLTALTAGLLWPRKTFWLEKYKTDRTWLGETRMRQNGRWQMLWPAFVPALACAIWVSLSIAVFVWVSQPAGIGLGIAAGLFGLYAVAHYRVESLRILAAHKDLGGVGLDLGPSPFRVLMIHVLGYLLVIAILFVPAMVLGVALVALQSIEQFRDAGLGDQLDWLSDVPRWIMIALSALIYFLLFLLWGALSHAFVTMPLIRHYALRMRLIAPEHLAAIRQRPRDDFAEAEGFAEALDVGASI